MSKLETRAVVVKIDGNHALVRANQADGCEHCAGKVCGAGKLSSLFCSKPRQFEVINPINARIGDEVIVSVAEGAVMRGISLIYMMPLALLLSGATLGNVLSPPGQSDSYAAAGALLGLVVGFALVKRTSMHKSESLYRPIISRQVHKSSE